MFCQISILHGVITEGTTRNVRSQKKFVRAHFRPICWWISTKLDGVTFQKTTKAMLDKAVSLAYGVCDLRWRQFDSPLYIESVPLCQSVSLTTCHLFQFITLKRNRCSAMGQWNEFESEWLAGSASLGTAGLNEFSGSMGKTAGFCASIYMSSSHFFFLLPFFFRLLCCGKHTYRQERTKLITTSAVWTPLYLCAFY